MMKSTFKAISVTSAGIICLIACFAILNTVVVAGVSGIQEDESAIQEEAVQVETVQEEEAPSTTQEPQPATPADDQERTAEEFEEWGHLTGKFVLTGDVPEIEPENVDKDQATCITNGEIPLDDNLLVGANGELKDVFVMMYLKDSPKPEVHPSYDAKMLEPVVLDNVKCRFVPHASFVRVGQTIQLKNSDDVGHNCHLVGFANEINTTLGPGQSVDAVMDLVETSPGNVVCDIHEKWMDGVFLVREEPYVAISAADGTFTIENIPEGTWQFQFWHKRTSNMKKLNVEGYDVGRKGNIEVTIVKGETVDLGEMTYAADDLK